MGGLYIYAFKKSYSLLSTSSTVSNNSASNNGGGVSVFYSPNSSLSNYSATLTNSTFVENLASDNGGGIYVSFLTSSPFSPPFSINIKSSILALNSNDNIYNSNNPQVITSEGYNIFSDAATGYSISTDQVNIDSASLKLSILSFNGGFTKTKKPNNSSVAVDMGNPLDGSDAQNGGFIGRRDVGAAESCISVVYDTVITCSNYLFGGNLYGVSGVYYDSLININGCDSIIRLDLSIVSVRDTLLTIDICEGDSILIFGNYETISGFYYDSLTNNVSGCGGAIVIIQELIVNPSYEAVLTPIIICEGDSTLIFGNDENISGFYYDSLFTINGCDSIIVQELIIYPLDLTTSQSDLTLTANQTVAAYQWLDCSNGNIPIVGETSQNYTVTSNGDYAVVVTTGNCSDTSDCISINDVSLLENIKESNITVYPNPNTGTFTIDFKGSLSKNTEVIIFNVIGEKVVHLKPINELEQIDLSSFENGVYFVNIVSKSVTKVVRIIKQ